eukprot:4146389-Amphidinium_carterae.1
MTRDCSVFGSAAWEGSARCSSVGFVVQAVEEASFSRGDVVFTIGESIEKMCYIVTGLLSYGLCGEMPLSASRR